MSDGIKKQKRQIVVELTIPKNHCFPIISWLIRLSQWRFFKQKWSEVPSHARVRFFDLKHQVWWIYEASQSSLKLIGLNQAEKKTKVLKQYEVYVEPETKKQMVININGKIGMDYGKMQLVGLLWVKFFALFGIKTNNPFTENEVCTEAVYWVLSDNDKFKEVLSKYKPDTVDLCDIIDIMEALK